jgi:queuine tRNA-ribosyltransferase
MELTHRWLKRCFDQFKNTGPLYGYPQSLFPIVQGGTFPALRKKAAGHVQDYEADGYAIGGLSVGEPEEVMYEMTEIVTAELPENRPRYLMGVGTPVNILEAVDRGIDMFDCVMPTRNGRNGMLFTSSGIINIRNQKWANDHSPIDENGTSFADRYTKAYLRHLVVSNEMLGAQIASHHNLAFYMWLVNTARQKIIEGDFKSWKIEMVKQLSERL